MGATLTFKKKEVACNAIREVLEKGLPRPIPIAEIEADVNLTDNQRRILGYLREAETIEKRLGLLRGNEYARSSEPWNDGLKVRRAILAALNNGLAHVDLVTRLGVAYGALPDPDYGGKYFRLVDHSF